MITLHKIVLVGDDAPQNRSCGVVEPPQTRSCEEKKVNTKCKWDVRMQKREIFFFFFYEHGEKQEQREQRKEEHEMKLEELRQGEFHELPVHQFK